MGQIKKIFKKPSRKLKRYAEPFSPNQVGILIGKTPKGCSDCTLAGFNEVTE